MVSGVGPMSCRPALAANATGVHSRVRSPLCPTVIRTAGSMSGPRGARLSDRVIWGCAAGSLARASNLPSDLAREASLQANVYHTRRLRYHAPGDVSNTQGIIPDRVNGGWAGCGSGQHSSHAWILREGYACGGCRRSAAHLWGRLRCPNGPVTLEALDYPAVCA